MKILIYSPAFAPKIGGMEAVMEMLATRFHEMGHEICVICKPADDGQRAFPYTVVRQPGFLETLRWWRWSDVVMHANVSLKGLLPFLFVRRPWVATHHGWYSLSDRPPTLLARIKIGLARRFAARNIAVSQAVASYLGFPCDVIANPYLDHVFHLMPEVNRDRDVLFVGRLVSDKAPLLLVEAAGILKSRGLAPSVTFVGAGPEEPLIRARVHQLGIGNQVRFAGVLRGAELARIMNQHRILAVPSIVREGFGVVVIEGIACGCSVVCSDAGALPEAVGPCGAVFKSGDADDFADELRAALVPDLEDPATQGTRQSHVEKHRAETIADRYLNVLRCASSE